MSMIFKNVTVAHAALTDVAPAVGVRAFKDFATVDTGQLTTVVEARVEGTAGNSFTLALVADGDGQGLLTKSGNDYTFHFESGRTTVGDFENAIELATQDLDDLQVKTSGTVATVLVTADAFTATSLAGGVNPSGIAMSAFGKNVAQSDLWLIQADFAGNGTITAYGYSNDVWHLINDVDKVVVNGLVGAANTGAAKKCWFVKHLGAFDRVYFKKETTDGVVNVKLTDVLAANRKN